MSRWTLPRDLTGVYRIVFDPSGACYVGGSGRCIANRIGWHLCMLRKGVHSSPSTQEEWNNSVESDWSVEVLEVCSADNVREREKHWTAQYDTILSAQPAGMESRSAASRQKSRESRARYLETPGAREKLAEKARQQHAEGNFGRSTWR